MKSRTLLNKPQEHAWVSASAVEEVPCAELQDDQQVEDRTFLNHSQLCCLVDSWKCSLTPLTHRESVTAKGPVSG